MMCSRDEIKAYLHNLSSCNNLTSNPKENHSRMKQMGSERALFWLFSSSGRKWAREREWEGVCGNLYPLSQKLAVGRAVSGNSGYMSPDIGVRRLRTRGVLQTGNSNPETPGLSPDTPDTLSGHSGLRPGHSGLDTEFHIEVPFWVVGWFLMIFVGSLEHNYHIYTSGSKFPLIVRRSYTQFQK
jgi:hypothetical protein